MSNKVINGKEKVKRSLYRLMSRGFQEVEAPRF
jgi:hypothetical protein